MKDNHKKNWPELCYESFKSTAHLLHMATQIIGKLKLHTPFQPHWANVVLLPTSRGVTTGPIPYNGEVFSVDINLIDHEVCIQTSWANSQKLALKSMSVAQFTQQFFNLLEKLQIKLNINFMPQEIEKPIPFDKDTKECSYDHTLAHNWWRILLNSYCVMLQYHALFNGETPAIGLMWGTFDLRDARYNGQPVPTTGANSGYIRRNAMDEEQVEIGWWHGNDNYQKPAYYSFTYPQPNHIEEAKIKPTSARWDPSLAEFILDYDDIRHTSDPAKELLEFFTTTYQAGAHLGNWDPKFITSGKPI